MTATPKSYGQTKITATAPKAGAPAAQLTLDGGAEPLAETHATAFLMVDTSAFRKAGAQALEDLQTLQIGRAHV